MSELYEKSLLKLDLGSGRSRPVSAAAGRGSGAGGRQRRGRVSGGSSGSGLGFLRPWWTTSWDAACCLGVRLSPSPSAGSADSAPGIEWG